MAQLAFAAFWVASIFSLVTAAMLYGAWPERVAAVLSLMAWLGCLLVIQLSQAWVGPNAGLLIIDFCLFLAFLAIGFKSEKVWPLIACGFQLCGVCLHIAYWAKPQLLSYAYFVAMQITSCAVLAAIGVGVFQAYRSKRPVA